MSHKVKLQDAWKRPKIVLLFDSFLFNCKGVQGEKNVMFDSESISGFFREALHCWQFIKQLFWDGLTLSNKHVTVDCNSSWLLFLCWLWKPLLLKQTTISLWSALCWSAGRVDCCVYVISTFPSVVHELMMANNRRLQLPQSFCLSVMWRLLKFKLCPIPWPLLNHVASTHFQWWLFQTLRAKSTVLSSCNVDVFSWWDVHMS